jgi:acyl carrier protein
MASAPDRMTFEEFRKAVSEIIKVDDEKMTAESSFINDLFVDSILMLEVILTIEQFGVSLSPEAAWRVQTLGDAYEYYLDHRENA